MNMNYIRLELNQNCTSLEIYYTKIGIILIIVNNIVVEEILIDVKFSI